MNADEVMERLTSPLGLWIGGASVSARTGRTIAVMNPARGEVFAHVDEADAEDVDDAVKAARKAFGEGAWPKLSASARAKVLWRIADLIDANKEWLAQVESMNNGKLLREALKGDLPSASEIFRYYAGWATKVQGETIPVEGGQLCYTLREPVGVCGQIVPWNFPLLMAAWKLAPALATGNTVVLKPSEFTPLTALFLAEICHEAGVPPGVVNVVPGYGPTAGEALARHMDVDKLAFTGSTRTGRRLLVASAESNLKRVSLELGGKSPLVVMPDADLDMVVRHAAGGIFSNKGEICAASSRVLVHASVHDALVEKLAERARKTVPGDPMSPRSFMGAQCTERQMNAVLAYIAKGVAEGAVLVAGGRRDTDGDKSRGFFVLPTVFDKVTPDMTIAREEIFGPVLSVMTFETEDEAVALANGTTYGLVAAVFTRDVARAHRMAKRIQAGTVWVNLWNGFDSAAPFGGVKQSGFGREMGQHALELYTQTKCVWVPMT